MPNRNTPRVTTTVTPSPIAGKRITSLARSHAPLSKVQVTPEIMENNPELAARVISDMQEAVLRASEGSRSNPFNFSYIAQNQKLTNGVQTNITHNLGVAWQYAFVVKQYPGAGPIFACVEVPKSSYPPALNKTQVASFVPWGYLTLQGTLTLTGGTKAITVAGLLPSSFASVSILTPGGTLGVAYKVVPTLNTLTVTAINSSGALVNTDTSTLSWFANMASFGNYDIIIVGQ